jgi:hypothetical protein
MMRIELKLKIKYIEVLSNITSTDRVVLFDDEIHLKKEGEMLCL